MESMHVEDICRFLDSLQLSDAVPAFQKNGVDGPFLLVLSDEDLQKELGMSNLQIRKLRAAMKERKLSDTSHDSSSSSKSSSPERSRAVPAVAVVASPAGPSPYPPQTTAAAPPVMQVPSGPNPQTLHQALQLLSAADSSLARSAQLLSSALGTQAMQTGANVATPFRRGAGAPLARLMIDARQHQQTDEAEEAAAAAMRYVAQARSLVPTLPPIRQPQVAAQGGAIVQGLTRGVVMDSVRTGKAKASLESVNNSRRDVQHAQAVLSGQLSQAQAQAYTPPAAMAAAPPPAAYNAPPPAMYGAAASSQPQQVTYVVPPSTPAATPAGRSAGAAAAGGLVVGAMAGRRMEHRMDHRVDRLERRLDRRF